MNDTPVRVLLADDDPLLRTSMTRLLRGRPDIDLVAAVADGVQALRALTDELRGEFQLALELPAADCCGARFRCRRC